MRTTWTRAALVVSLLSVMVVSGMTLLAGPDRSSDLERPAPVFNRFQPAPAPGFQACPWPPCMAPCVLGAPPEVTCMSPDGTVTQTTFFCCCCGSGQSSYRPI